MERTAIVTGCTGQDGSFLSDLLLSKGYKVYGLKRRTSSHSLGCAAHLAGVKDFEAVEGDLNDLPSLMNLCKLAKADEFYNLAGQSHVATSFAQPGYTLEATGHGVLNCLEAIRAAGFFTKFYQAGSSEMWGGIHGRQMMTEEVPFHPRSPYGCAKLYGHWITVNYREAYKMFACNGILHNHESERRGPNFVTRKITLAIAAIKAGKQSYVSLGNLDSERDWGYAPDYVEGMWMMLQQGSPDDYVLATGETHTVREFCKLAFEVAGLGDYNQYIKIDPNLYRPAEVDVLIGNAAKAHKILGWKPKTTFAGLVEKMVAQDCKSSVTHG